MKKISINYITYDGVLNQMCGVGAISRTFIESFLEVRKLFLEHDIELSLNLLTVALAKGADGFNENLLQRSKSITSKCGGDVYFIINDSSGDNQFGVIENWRAASISAATKALELAQKYDESLFYCIDTPFLHVPYYINRQKIAYDNQNIKCLLVLHSDVLIHHPVNPDFKRLEWESSAIKYLDISENVYIAKTSKFLVSHLKKNYCIQETKLIDFQSGILPIDYRFTKHNQKVISKVLKDYGIPLNKKLVFSVGRAVEYKGLEELIDSFVKLKQEAHLVFIASGYNDRFCNINELKSLMSKKKINCTPIFKIDFELPKYITQWHNTKIVAQLAKHEPFGLVPEDTRILARHGGPVILASNREGFLEQIDDGKDGFLVDISDTSNIAEKIDYILGLPDNKLETIRRNGFNRALREYDYRISITKSIIGLVEDNIKLDFARVFDDNIL